ncbi:MAG: 4-hydroxy-tetrahydrodipicolinate synthase [Candidatus Omnitrophica bacterium]|nr:4-hydroxy-tetrahydrodipicolinate synthase [Candidatus Omnitrophota bacterium]
MSLTLRGSMVALVTPFRNDAIDERALASLVERHVTAGTSALVPCGTTGESATLSHEEHDRVIDLTVQTARGRIPVIAGTGSNNTREAIRLTQHAKQAGADGALLISPYYNKPTQRGLYLHFQAIAEAVEIPIVLYNIASRTAVNIEPETFAQLAGIPNIVGVKEASGNLEQMSRILQMTKGKLALLSGDDALTLPVLSIGGTGVISVAANLVPQDVAAMVEAFQAGRHDEAIRWHQRLLPLVKALFLETNPIPVKTAMGLLGLIEAELRLPLCEMSEANVARLKTALQEYGLLTQQGSPSLEAGGSRLKAKTGASSLEPRT